MRIVFITSSKNASGGGRQALYLASGLTARGHAVSVFSPPESQLRPLAPDLDWLDLPARRGQWRKALEGAMPQGEPAVMHAFHNKAVKSLAWFGTLWRLTGRPVACVAHRGVVNPPTNILPYIAPGIRLFAVNSRACLETLPLLWRKSAGKVVYNCVPESKVTPTRDAAAVRAELGVTQKTVVIGSVSNNSPIKGQEFLLRAFARMRADGQVLCLVGGAEEKWSPLCRELGILEHVRLIPRTEKVADYLQLFTLFVLPSLSESSPNTLLEAMCMGLPAVCSNVGGVPECISDERCLVPPGDAEALAAAMAGALDDKEGLATAARHNKAFSAQFSVAKKLDIMEGLYTDLLRPYTKN
ncbi:Glycosyl transferase group 1 [uncultured delta proteobacterium]|uniref:Glycosyl transferase group 1 n=1 Tax=uncultured delta proteobacterium TaxID=34034 RepID=A0A212J9B7_9DELT|nr:Glycosyl transferase group 1 [uncultured delta proteobacterium]